MSQKNDISFLPLGANLHTFTVSGVPLVVSLPSTPAYISTGNPAYFGETIGRIGNRVKAAKIELNNTTYSLPANNGPNTLHGGPKGWGKKEWSGPHAENRNGKEAVRFELRSEDGDMGFPGTVLAKAWYIASTSSSGQTDLEVEYEVRFADDGPEVSAKGSKGEDVQETAIAVTNHTAFSIGPDAPKGQTRSIAGTRVTFETALRQEVDDEAIPTGKISAHPLVTVGKEIELGAKEPVFDDSFVYNSDPASVPLDTRSEKLNKLISFYHPETKIRFEAWSTEPAFQFYTGEFIDLEYEDKDTGVKHDYRKRAGFCVEAQRYIDAAGNKDWRPMVLLKRGQVWGSRTVYKAWKDESA